MKSRLSLLLIVLSLALAATGCLSLPFPGMDNAETEVEALAAALGELIGEDDVEAIADLLIYPATLIFFDEILTFNNKAEFVTSMYFSYDDAELVDHQVSVIHAMASGNSGSAVVHMVSEWNADYEDWMELIVMDVRMVRSAGQWKISLVDMVAVDWWVLD